MGFLHVFVIGFKIFAVDAIPVFNNVSIVFEFSFLQHVAIIKYNKYS